MTTTAHPALKLLALPFTAREAGIREKGPEKREMVEAALRAAPEVSNREHGRRLGVNHHFVGDVRRTMSRKASA